MCFYVFMKIYVNSVMSHHTREKCFILIYIAKTSWWISLKWTKFIFKLWRVFHTDVTGMLRDFYKWWRKTVNVFMLDRFMYLSSHLYMYRTWNHSCYFIFLFWEGVGGDDWIFYYWKKTKEWHWSALKSVLISQCL